MMDRRKFLGWWKAVLAIPFLPKLLGAPDKPILMAYKGKCDIEPGYVIAPYAISHYAWEQTRVSELRVGDVFRFLDDPCRVVGNPMEVEEIFLPFPESKEFTAADGRVSIGCVDVPKALLMRKTEWVIVRRVREGLGKVRLLTSREDVEMSGEYSQRYNVKSINPKFYKRIKLT